MPELTANLLLLVSITAKTAAPLVADIDTSGAIDRGFNPQFAAVDVVGVVEDCGNGLAVLDDGFKKQRQRVITIQFGQKKCYKATQPLPEGYALHPDHSEYMYSTHNHVQLL